MYWKELNKMVNFSLGNSAFIQGLQDKVNEYKAALAKNDISKTEYDALTAQLLDLKQVDEKATTIEEKQMLQTAIETLIQIAQSVPIP